MRTCQFLFLILIIAGSFLNPTIGSAVPELRYADKLGKIFIEPPWSVSAVNDLGWVVVNHGVLSPRGFLPNINPRRYKAKNIVFGTGKKIYGAARKASGAACIFEYKNRRSECLYNSSEPLSVFGVAADGTVIGIFNRNDGVGFIFKAGNLILLPAPDGYKRFVPTGINDNDQIVGVAYRENYFDSYEGHDSFLLEDGNFTHLDIPDFIGSTAMINNSSQIVVSGYQISEPYYDQASYVIRGPEIVRLPFRASGLAADGTVTGIRHSGLNLYESYVWRNGVAARLNDVTAGFATRGLGCPWTSPAISRNGILACKPYNYITREFPYFILYLRPQP